jgi:hypothetical protein
MTQTPPSLPLGAARQMPRRRRRYLGSVVLGLLVTGACGERPTLPPAALAGATLQVVASQSPQESVATSRRTAIVDAVGRVGPAVVSSASGSYEATGQAS